MLVFILKKRKVMKTQYFLKLNVLSQIPLFFEKNTAKKNFYQNSIATTAYNRKRVLILSCF